MSEQESKRLPVYKRRPKRLTTVWLAMDEWSVHSLCAFHKEPYIVSGHGNRKVHG